ncbi:hypothetical protein ACFVHQ_19560 [Actinomycetes bacterium NPDC127524]
MQKGKFDVNAREFKKDPDKEAARVAYKWIREIKQASSHDLEILQVKYSEEKDITDLVKEEFMKPFD